MLTASLSLCLPLCLAAAFCRLPVTDAWCRCNECIDSVTVNLQVANTRYAGSDNENSPHFLDLLFYCNPHKLPVPPPPAVAAEVVDLMNETLPEPFRHNPAAIGFETVTQTIDIKGLIIRGHTRTYKVDIDSKVLALCGKCPTPKNLVEANIRAGHSDGINVKSVSIIANFPDKISTMLTLDRSFARGFVDTTTFPKSNSVTELSLTKAGC